MPPRPPVPVHVVSGPLGVGKTTALRALWASRPPNERWAVLVNEFGKVGVDGPLLEVEGLAVREVAGGCICCTAGLELRVALVRLLQSVKPDRLLIEPSGVARPATVIDVLRSPGLAEAVDVRAVLTLVDPREVLGGRVERDETFADQVLLADVLVGNRADLCTPEELEAFVAWGEALDPPKLVVATTSFGALEPAWLELRPPSAPSRHEGHHLHGDGEAFATEGGGQGARGDGIATCGWVWPHEVVFDRLLLEVTLQEMVHGAHGLPAGALRIKGIFRTPRVVLEVHASPEAVRFRPLDWRRDSRVEVLAAGEPAPAWETVEAAWVACRVESR